MAYLDVLPLADVKTYLKIDDTQSVTDSEITSMIKSSLAYIERHTNILLYARDKDYVVSGGCAKIYDYPINSLVDPATATTEVKTLYTNYTIDSTLLTMTLNVGYVLPADVPSELIDLAKVMVRVMFYEEPNTQSFKEMLPMWAVEILNSNKRFIL